jgi:hypothetical protein
MQAVISKVEVEIMLKSGSLPLRRRTCYLALPAALLIATGAFPAVAQSQNADSFSSSSQGLVALDADPGLPASPSPAMGAGAAGQNGTYGYHNRNWSSHLTFEAGGGANGPTSDSSNYITWGGNFTVGAGYRLTSHLSGLIEYQFIDDKLPGALIGETGADGGNAHIWSLTLAPVVDLFPKATNDVYVTGGGGFYRKVTNFTDPEESYYCDYYYYDYCGVDEQNVVVGHFSSNQGGWNVGAGFTHRLGGTYGNSNMKLFAEVRYLDVLTPAVNGETPSGLGVTTVGADTKLIPITLGIRF